MNTLFQPWFDAQLASMTRQVSPPVAPFRYGTDMSCGEDIPDDFSEVSPDDYQGLSESIIRRLLTPRGGLIDDPTYGDGLVSLLHHGITTQELASIRQRIEDECKKDDRVDTVVVDVSPVPEPLSTGQMIINMTVTAQDRNQDFNLILSVDGSGHIVEIMVTQAVI